MQQPSIRRTSEINGLKLTELNAGINAQLKPNSYLMHEPFSSGKDFHLNDNINTSNDNDHILSSRINLTCIYHCDNQ